MRIPVTSTSADGFAKTRPRRHRRVFSSRQRNTYHLLYRECSPNDINSRAAIDDGGVVIAHAMRIIMMLKFHVHAIIIAIINDVR